MDQPTKAQLRIFELEARADDLRAEGCERLADILQAWADRLREKAENYNQSN